MSSLFLIIISLRIDRGIELVRRHAREHQTAVSAGDAVKAAVSANMMNEAKRQAIDEVHDKLEVL